MALVSDMFAPPDDATDDLKKQLMERQKKAMAAGHVGTPGKVSTLMGYLGNQAGSSNSLIGG